MESLISPSFQTKFCLVNVQPGDRSMVVYERGCLRAGEEWVEFNLIPVAGAAVGIAILQVQ
jgi:hypothetical protein